ncbi:MAG: transketolase family protein [bacterium]|nr:transketolase family protein [bacterium]
MTAPAAAPVRKAMRDAFGEAIVRLAETDDRIVVLTADLAESIRVHHFAGRFPDRFFQMGISEQDMIGTAAGLALTGFIPFATTFAVFAASRANEQVRLAVCYNRANVKIAVSHGGLSVGEDGATHQALEDLAAMRALPHMTVVSPADALETERATAAIAALDGPAYLRLGRTPTPIITRPDTPFVLGKGHVMRGGRDVTVVATGTMVHVALGAARLLEAFGVDARVINIHTIKPLDVPLLERAARETGAIVTVEEHNVIGGLAGAVSESLARAHPVPVEFVGIQDVFGESGKPDELWKKYGLTPERVAEAARRAMDHRDRLGRV